jgi:hypothetical protein
MLELAASVADIDDLPVYPLSPDDTLEAHFFLAWHHREWLNSDMRLKGAEECRALYFDLICISQDQKPIGTLPRCPEILAKMLMVDQSRFQRLAAQPYGPLHRWEPCLCGDEVRLMHERVLRMLTDAISRKHDNRARTEAANVKKRLQRLRSYVAGFNVDLSKSDTPILWMDNWLEEQGVVRRNAQSVERAIAAWSAHSFNAARRSRPGS